MRFMWGDQRWNCSSCLRRSVSIGLAIDEGGISTKEDLCEYETEDLVEAFVVQELYRAMDQSFTDRHSRRSLLSALGRYFHVPCCGVGREFACG